MKILFYVLNYYPDQVGAGKYTSELAEYFKASGNEVKVITANPYYPEWEVRSGYRKYWYTREIINGIKVLRCPIWVPKKPGGIKRILHLISFSVTSFIPLVANVFWKPGVVFMVEPTLFVVPQGIFISRLVRAKTWLHVQDLEVDAAYNLQQIPGSLFRIGALLEKKILATIDVVSTISEKMSDKIREKVKGRSDIYVFRNWVNCHRAADFNTVRKLKRDLGIGGEQIVVLYSGTIGEKQGIDTVIEAARKLTSNPDIVFIICGEGPKKEEMREFGKALVNLIWLPVQDEKRYIALLEMAHIQLLPQRSNASDLVMPSKLAAMLMSGKSVIATVQDGTEVARMLDGISVIVEPENADDLANAIRMLACDSNLRLVLGERGKEYAKRTFSSEEILPKFSKVIESLEMQ